MKIVRFGRQSAKALLIVILFCVFAFGPGAGVSASVPNAPAINLRIRDRYLLSAYSVNFIMRGVNHMHTWFPDNTNALGPIKNKGANTVRVVLSSGDVPGWDRNSASDVANVIRLCKARRLICVLEVHDTTGYGESPDAISLAQAVNYWKEIQNVLTGQEAYVIINIGNEPYGNVNTQTWVRDTKNAIQALRAAGFQHVLMVDAPDWGQDWEFIMRDNAANVFASDPLRKTMFSIHMYGVFDTRAKVRDYLLHFVTARLPLVIGEFGHFHTDGDPDEDAIMFFADKYGIGYMGWAWSGNCCGGEYLDMVTDFDPAQMTWWGRRIFNGANGIRLTSLEASIYSGERNPRVVSVTRVHPNPTNRATVRFTVTFSEPVTGVDTTAPFRDFRLVTTGVTGAAISAVSGTGAIYAVTVSTGTGDGTIRLDVLDNDTILDARRNTLGGPGPGYGNFKTGETYTVMK